MTGVTLDAGALAAFDRNDRVVVGIVRRAVEIGATLAIPAGVVGQSWRDGRTQARLARLLASPIVEIETLDDLAREARGNCAAPPRRAMRSTHPSCCARGRASRRCSPLTSTTFGGLMQVSS
jgi:hypothetical protein